VALDGEIPVFPCTYENIVDEVKPGHRVLINDGLVRALATESEDGELRCRVTVGGKVTTGKGVNLPDSDISAPAITERDWECVRFAVDKGLDYLALSFVRRAEEVRDLKRRLDALCADDSCGLTLEGPTSVQSIPVIAKIEKPQAVQNIEDILEVSDGVMVARGDLGVEMDLASVPITQKLIINQAQEYGKPCIVATQMLETMIERPTPTRAEASDVANAIFDNADAVMLSGETAVGKYPALAVQTMHRIAVLTEARLRELPQESTPLTRALERGDQMAAVVHGAWRIALDIHARIVAVWSQTGQAARYLSFIGLRVPIIAFSSDVRAVRRMALLHGVFPVHESTHPVHRSDFDRMVNSFVLQRELATEGDPIVLLSGKPFGKPGSINTVAIRTVTAPRAR
ncbi:MAG: pyruvate kinase, partial [Planctomycetota bacterium]|nr:pyruvate kinase [Planctomycetota bacterium]